MPETEVCPLCGRPMVLKVARRGHNQGRRFWSCTGYGTGDCEGTLDYPEEPAAGAGSSASVSSSPVPSEIRPAQNGLPRPVFAGPLHAGLDTLYFEYLTVSDDELSVVLAERERYGRIMGGQWRVSYVRPRPAALEPALSCVFSVVDKVLARGRVTRLDPSLEEALGRESPPRTLPGFSTLPDPALDSDQERWLWNEFLPQNLGPDFRAWVTPQVEIASLTGEPEYAGTGQRVDFLVFHPDLVQPLVVEVDGAQHASQTAADVSRDAHLSARGYRVVRVTVAEVRNRGGEKLTELTGLLARLAPLEHYARRLGDPCRRAGQMQLVLLHALYAGLLSPAAGTLRVHTDLIAGGGLSAAGFGAILTDFTTLVQNVGEMYGVALGGVVPSKDAEDADFCICFGDRCGGANTVFVEEACLPLEIQWPSRPARSTLPVKVSEEGMEYFLRRIFRKAAFRPKQYDIIWRALLGKDTVGLLPTGAGKSIAFQLAAMLLPGRTIVVAPILSLIRDQVENLRYQGIDRALEISSDLAGREGRAAAYEVLMRGDAFFCYIAPERFQMKEFRDKLRAMAAAFPVNMVVVDEAHCVSEWGHDFRTSYLRLGQTARETCASGQWVPPIIALTGTASRAVLRDLQRELMITDFEAVVTPDSFDRKELRFAVLHESSDAKPFVLGTYLAQALPSEFGLSREAFYGDDGADRHCGIVFCPNVNGSFGVVDVRDVIRRAGVDAWFYSSGRPKNFRGDDAAWKNYKRQTERAFKENEVPVLAATKAYGMGIDKENVRFTVHYGMPQSLEAFYQEAGRAGRDGQDAVCAVIVSDDRPDKNRHLLAPATPVEEVADFVRSTRFEDNDDITRMLYFHVEAFKGVETESRAIAGLLSLISPTGEQAKRRVPFGDDADLREKALHRLVVLGVISDYTVDYSAKVFDVLLAGADRESVIGAYGAYVASYERSRGAAERRKAEALPDGWDELVRGAAELYVRFVYDVIERGRRRAIAEMLAASRSATGEELRQRILDYFEQTEYSEAVESILSSDDVGMAVIASVLGEISGPDDAATLRGTVARSLETYPDHPGLLLLRAVAEALTRNGEPETVVENFKAFLKNALEGYGMPAALVTGGVACALRAVARKDPAQALGLEQEYLSIVPDREQMRSLVAQAGLQSAKLTPWLLLERIASSVICAQRSDTESR